MPEPELSAVITTLNRCEILLGTLERFGRQETDDPFEVIVVSDGSSDGTSEAVRSFSARSTVPVRLLEQAFSGQSAARNRGIAAARAPVCLFLNDDTRPRVNLVARHIAFHRRRPRETAVLLGGVAWAPEAAPSPFMEWLLAGAVAFAHAEIADAERVPGRLFCTANVSAKTEFLQAAAGFDECFVEYGYEDIECGLRLERAGMQLAYDPVAVVEHYHPVELDGWLERMRLLGRSTHIMIERVPGWPVPLRPGTRHRVKAALLTVALLTRIPSAALRQVRWRFLCDEAFREGFWNVAPRGSNGVRIGATLARISAADPATRTPALSPGDADA